MSRLPRAIVLVLLALLTACGGYNMKRSPRDEMLYAYTGVIRWSDFDRAVGFIDPLTLEMDPIDPIDLERLKQFQVTGYEVRTANEISENEYEQVVEVRVVNKHTQAERAVVDRQLWRWDPMAGRWWLVSGLPDVTAAD